MENEIAYCDMYVVGNTQEMNQVRIKLSYEKEPIKQQKASAPVYGTYVPYPMNLYGYIQHLPSLKKSESLSILVSPSMANEFNVGDKIRVTLTKEEE